MARVHFESGIKFMNYTVREIHLQANSAEWIFYQETLYST